jgi:hypothetical protein
MNQCLTQLAAFAARLPTPENLAALDGAVDRYRQIRAAPIPTPSAAASTTEVSAAISTSSAPATGDKTVVLSALATHEAAVKALYKEMHDARKAAGALIKDLNAWGAALDGFIAKINTIVNQARDSYNQLAAQPRDNDVETSWKRLKMAMGAQPNGSPTVKLYHLAEGSPLFEAGIAHHFYERGGKITTVTDFQRDPDTIWTITNLLGVGRSQPVAEHQKRAFGPIKLLTGTEFTLGGKIAPPVAASASASGDAAVSPVVSPPALSDVGRAAATPATL